MRELGGTSRSAEGALVLLVTLPKFYVAVVARAKAGVGKELVAVGELLHDGRLRSCAHGAGSFLLGWRG
jgi:hypothetical protein